MATLYHQVRIAASPRKLYEAISTERGIAAWWDEPVAVGSGTSQVLEFRPGPAHGVLRMKVLERREGRRVEWECTSTHPETSPASAWTGTHVAFEIREAEGGAILDFRHSGWDEASPFLGFCNFGWGVALQKLKETCEAK
jgi:uncharacterized protein YndB with AHSA1/START domain